MSNLVKVTETQQVVVREVATNAIKVTAPTAPAVIKIITEGPQAPVTLFPATLIDASTAGTIYVGSAPAGTQESAAVWTITRSTYSPAGIRTSKGTATAVTWTGRTSHTYA